MSTKIPPTSSGASHLHFNRAVACLLLLITAGMGPLLAQVPGPNVNMVSGTQWPGGDPFLQRQNEPSMAVSSRNPLHMLAGANDYRTVDLPGVSGAAEPTGDAWLGLFKSFDGGQTWTSTLIPGYPQDRSLQALLSPIRGLGAGADPSVRAGTNGMFYYSGLAFNRQDGGASKVFVASYTDDNNLEGGDSIRYLWTTAAESSSGSNFEDKPSLAVDIPRASSGYCIIPTLPLQNTQIFPAGTVYVAWTEFIGGADSANAQIRLSRSTNCGLTWSSPETISKVGITSQGAALAIDPNTGTLYVVWRVFASTTPAQGDAIMYSASYDGGNSFSKPALLANIAPFDQGDTSVSFRTNSLPSIAIDAASHVYVAWSQRGVGPGGDARVVVATGTPIASHNPPLQFTAPAIVDPWPGRGHQIMPALAFSAGKLTAAWYDLRNDDLIAEYTPLGGGQFSGTLLSSGGAPDYPAFGSFIADPTVPYQPDARRQTLDVRAAQAQPGNPPSFFSSVQVSQYAFGSTIDNPSVIQQLEVNAPNLPMFQTGTLPFIGDYIDVAGPTFIANHSNGSWRFNNQPSDPDFTHVVWTDNRNVVQPADGNWANYTPPTYGTSTTSIFDPTQQRPACIVSTTGNNTGDRNQDIYTALLSPGLAVSARGNAKPLGTVNGKLIQREFPVTVQNTTAQTRFYQLTIGSQPAGGSASFLQFPVNGLPNPFTQIDVQVPGLSATSRSIFVTSTDPHATVLVSVVELTSVNGSPVPGGQTGSVTINSDVSNPNIANPNIANTEIYNSNISNPTLSNPNIANPNIANPNIANPNIANPNIANVTVANPNIANPNIANPNIANPNIANPNIANPNIANPNIANAALTDATWTVTNAGNTATAYSVKMLAGQNPPQGVNLQLIVSQSYNTPAVIGCNQAVEQHFVPVANITNVVFSSAGNLLQPAATDPNAVAVSLLPGESAFVTMRVLDTTTSNPAQALQHFNPAVATAPAIVSQGANTGTTTPPIALIAVPVSLAPAIANQPYSKQLTATGGTGSYTWSSSGTLPTGMQVQAGGLLTGTPTSVGTFVFTANVTDGTQHSSEQLTLIVNPPAPAITSPLSGFNTISPLQVIGTSLANAGITVYDGAIQVGTGIASGGTFSVSVALSVGTGHSLTATQTVNSLTSAASAAVTGTIAPAAPVITSPATGFTTTSPVQVSGTAVGNGAITVYDGVTQVGTGTASGGTFSVSVTLSVGAGHSLTATQTINSLTSAASAAVTGTIAPPAPSITSPSNGFSTTSPVQVSGGGTVAGAGITVYDGATQVGTGTASGSTYSLSVPLSVGAGHSLTVTQTVNSITSAHSAAVTGTTAPPAPSITSPSNGFSTTSPVQVSGGGTVAGAGITVYDGATQVGTGTASGSPYSLSVPLSVGAGHSLTVTQTVNGVTSAASAAVTGTIVPPPSISGAVVPPATATANNAITPTTLSATGGTPPYTWSLNSGSLPTGVSLSPGGVISGTPTATGNFAYVVQVADSGSLIATASFSMNVGPQITAGPVTGFQNYTYPATLLGATGGAPPYTWSGASISGMNLTADGVMTGFPTLAATATVTVTDANGGLTSVPFTIVGPVSVQGAGGPSVTTISNVSLTSPGTVVQVTATPGATIPVSFNYNLVEGVGYCPGCIDQITVGFVNTLPTSCEYDGQPGPGGTGTQPASVNLTAPSMPGRYYIVYHKSQQFTCTDALATALSPSDPPIAVVDVIPLQSSTYLGVSISNVNLNASGGNAITVAAGVGAPINVSLSYTITDGPCPGCVDLIQIGFASGPPPNNACPYGPGIPGAPGVSGSNSVSLTAPFLPGRYFIGFDREEDFQCNSFWWSGNPGPDRYIGVVDVQ